MGEYNFTLHHKPGKANIKPDILSRRPDLKRGEKDNENITMLKEHHFRTQEFIFESLDNNFLRRVRASRKSRDRMVEKALLGKEKDWTEQDDGVVTWRHRVYVPKNKKLREDIIREHHDSVAAGHP